MGDSLSAGYGIDANLGWVKLMGDKLATKKSSLKIINASVSGETSSGGLARLSDLLKVHTPYIVIIELGGNDGLRGQPVKILAQNLQTMIDASKASGAKILLLGMQIPTNYGPRYTREFKDTYANLAEKNKIELVPFMLEGVASNTNLLLPDNIHPNEKAQPIIVNTILPTLENML